MKSYKEKTPCFILDKVDLDKNLKALKRALESHWSRYIIGYSFKTNSLPWLITYIKKEGCYAEVVSDTEYALADRLGYRPDTIIFNGPVKSRSFFEKALTQGSVVNIDSHRELEWLYDIQASVSTSLSIGLRVNYDLEKEFPGGTISGINGGRFGFNIENGEFEKALLKIREMKHVKIAGLHMHVSTRLRNNDIYKNLTKTALFLAEKYNLDLSYIDIGGGFFAGGTKREDFEGYIRTIVAVLKERYTPGDLTLIVEPGASLIASPISFVTKVVDVKDTPYNRFVITDGSRLNIDSFMSKSSYSYRLVSSGTRKISSQVVCGYTCMENDRIMTLKDEVELKEGNYLIYDCAGSYTMCFNPLFIEYLPTVFLKDGDEYLCIREKWGADEYLQKNIY